MTERYRQSPKVEHRRLMEFIELKIQEAETLGVLIPLTDRPETGGYQQGATPAAKGSTTKYKPKPKPTGKLVQHHPVANPDPNEMEELDSWSEAELPPVTDTQADVMALQARMLNLETMLQQVLNRLSQP